MTIRTAIIGAAGIVGGELIRLLAYHPHIGTENIIAVSTSATGKVWHDVHRDMVTFRNRTFAADRPSYNKNDCDVIFLCQGHGKSQEWMRTHEVSDDVVVVDLSADYRLNDAWVYGLPEVNRTTISGATRIANPGCFATCIELALLPLAERSLLGTSVVVNATTGSTGAGQQPTDTTHYSWRSNNQSVYKAFTHQHLDEIGGILKMKPTFVPLRGAFTRGILATCVLECNESLQDLLAMYEERYADTPFTYMTADLPDVKRVVNTNMCMVGMERSGNHLLVVGVIDNLLKGAAGQAIQNMNLACGFDERSGLLLKGVVY